jgi:hypothetical protein
MSEKKTDPIPDDPETLRLDIELTREELGQTVEELVHRLDVPARVKEQAHEKVERLKGQTHETVGLLKEKTGEARVRTEEVLNRAPGGPRPLLIGVGVLLAALVAWIVGRNR